MILKKLLLLIAFTGLIFASNLSVTINKIDNNNVSLEFNSSNYVGDNQQNWVALFKKNAPNTWENVRSWAWAKDLPQVEANVANSKVRLFKFKGEIDGTYEIRFFENNSYSPHTIQEIQLQGSQNQVFIRKTVQNEVVGDLIFKSSIASQAWVGIFKKDALSSRENIIQWRWVSTVDQLTHFVTHSIASGIYEARLFFHNSYDEEAKIEFTLNQNELPVFFDGIQQHSSKEATTIDIYLTRNRIASKDWIGVFKKNTQHIIDNLVAYAYIPTNTKHVTLEIYQPELLNEGEYDLLYFVRKSYTSYGQTGKLIVKFDNNIPL